MKTYRQIIRTYFKQHFIAVMGLLFAYGVLIVSCLFAIIRPESIFKTDGSPVEFSVFAMLLFTFDSVVHIRSLLYNNVSRFFPNYRRKVIETYILMLLPFWILPTIIFVINGFSVTTTLALHLSTFLIATAVVFRFGDGIIQLIAVIWLLRIVFETMGYADRLVIPSDWEIPEYVNYLLLSVSIIGISLSLHLQKNISISKLKKLNRNTSNQWAKDQDKLDGFNGRIIRKSFKNLLSKTENTYVNLVRRIQYAIVSPGYTSIDSSLVYLIVIVIYLFTFGTIFLRDEGFKIELIFSVYYILFFLNAGILSGDFLQHRDRWIHLWFISKSKNRKSFLNLIWNTFHFVILKQFMVLTIPYLLLFLLFDDIGINRIVPSIIIGLVFYLALGGLALLSNREVETADARGWAIGVNIFGIVFVIIYGFIQFKLLESGQLNALYIVLGCILTGAIILSIFGRLALHHTELDFPGEELS